MIEIEVIVLQATLPLRDSRLVWIMYLQGITVSAVANTQIPRDTLFHSFCINPIVPGNRCSVWALGLMSHS